MLFCYSVNCCYAIRTEQAHAEYGFHRRSIKLVRLVHMCFRFSFLFLLIAVALFLLSFVSYILLVELTIFVLDITAFIQVQMLDRFSSC